MTKPVFDAIMEGLTEALQVARGRAEPLRSVTYNLGAMTDEEYRVYIGNRANPAPMPTDNRAANAAISKAEQGK